ncbi:MAG: DUF2283 domain-containing protein [Chloroflexi bacterium]|nr:DUF2283 domain-containing protein [Chloroflexota bacterium]
MFWTASPRRWSLLIGRATLKSTGGQLREGLVRWQTDTLSIVLKDDASIVDSDEDKPGVILDYDSNGNLVSMKVLDASRRVSNTRRIEYQVAG